MPISIGTSGWAYCEWHGGFYPQESTAEAQLVHCVTHFTAAKINGTTHRTAYRAPSTADNADNADNAAVHDVRRLPCQVAARCEHPQTFSISAPRRNIP